jgi:GntR family transcriptional regulator
MVELGAQGEPLTTATGRAIYQQVADDLRSQIVAGTLRVDDPIPSTAELMKRYDISNTAVRNAVGLLRREGLVEGTPGKAVYVIAKPADVEAERISVEELTRQVGELRVEVQQLSQRLKSGDADQGVAAEVAELRGLVEQLYNRLGHPLPNDESASPRRRASGT